jgi:hypothetical protein
MDFAAAGAAGFRSLPAPDISLISTCYGPVILPVKLLSLRMKNITEVVEHKGAFAPLFRGIARFSIFSPCYRDQNSGVASPRTHASSS